jgi:hypothetical protein
MTAHAPRPDHILQTGLAFWASKTLLSAVEMEVFTELAKGPETLESLTSRLALHPRSSRDFLDALVALGFIERVNGEYANTPTTDLYLDKHKPSYIGGILEMANQRLFQHWGHLTTALRTGQRQSEASHGNEEVFASLYADPARLKMFLRAITGVGRGANIAIATRFPWEQYQSAADCGTGQGDLIVQVVLKNPQIFGIGFDFPEVAPIFEENVEANGLSSRVRFQGGSFFSDPLPKVDVILMGHILHNWNLEEKKMLIRKAYEAVPEGGAFIAYDALIDDDRSKNAFGLLMSLNMLIETRGGFNYTGDDCAGWMKEAGFRETRVEHLEGPDSMVIGIK